MMPEDIELMDWLAEEFTDYIYLQIFGEKAKHEI